ncbi:hypothetical protein SUGI_1423300, partial [Cryptomeria japonica]
MALIHCWVWVYLAAVGILFARADEKVGIWPMPAHVQYGSHTVGVSKRFALSIIGNNPPSHSKSSAILLKGFNRLLHNINLYRVQEDNTDHLLLGLRLTIDSWDDQLQFGTDESYTLKVPDPDYPKYACLKGNTIYGALHGLETLSQLCLFDSKTKNVMVSMAPWIIIDQPRFSYRGLLIDTSRHFQPLEIIKKVIDAMAYSKLNVLHWHIVDTQSFPLEIPSLPNLWNGAYSPSERYTMKDAREIVGYAQMRGINVLAEIDVPGHAASWGIGYPQLWPSSHCQQPLDVSNEFTFKVIDSILSDFSKVFKFKFVHLGGDEVDTSCWSQTRHIGN